MIIRREKQQDIEAASAVTIAAFRDHPISNHNEQYIVTALRAADALAVSLVAEEDERIVGHIAFSPIAISDGTTDWYGLGPVSVLPEYQNQGIGQALINEGLSLLQKMGAKGCALVGDPGYYKRFGFLPNPALIHEGVPPEFFLVLPFCAPAPAGTVVFHEAFQATR